MNHDADADNNSNAALLARMAQFVLDEKAAAERHLNDIWSAPLADKLNKGTSQAFTRLERTETNAVWAYLGEGESRFRVGDLLLLHTRSPMDGLLGRQLAFELEEDDRWLLTGRRVPEVMDAYRGGPCYADPDQIDLTPLFKIALEDIGSSPVGRDIVLPLLGGRLEITFDDRDATDAEHTALNEGFDADQARAIGLACGAHQVACIQGPPGTGKTGVLARAVQMMAARGERVLVTSHTHMAINNALNRVHRLGVPVAKVGPHTQHKGLDEAVPRVGNLGEWDERPTNGYVVGATPFATCSRRLEDSTFETIVFDEASQITVPLALMAMRKGKRYVFVGDQAQLPPVLMSRSVLDADDPGNAPSMFAALTSRHTDHHVMLGRTYRMNRWLTAWPGRTSYGGRIEAARGNRDRCLDLPAPHAVPPRLAPVLVPTLAPVASGIFIPTLDRAARTRNRRDAALVRDLCVAAIDAGLQAEQIGIVTPYRAQGRAIRDLLVAQLGRGTAQRIVADTVERMQGQEREVVIVSLATGDETFLGAVAPFVFQRQRLNVSITRAKTKLIVIGPWLDHVPEVEHPLLRAWIAEYADLQRQLVRVDLSSDTAD